MCQVWFPPQLHTAAAAAAAADDDNKNKIDWITFHE